MLLDFSRAFDHIDHNILLEKWTQSDVPEFLVKWKHSFLCDRQQRVRINNNVSDWKSPSGGTPQGTKSGGKDFKRMVKDMSSVLPLFKYVDDTTLNEICDRNISSDLLQEAASEIGNWCSQNKMLINAKKTKELVIDFARIHRANPNHITIDGQQIEQVDSAKLLGLTISDDLSWETHVNNITKKANQRLFMLRLLRRAQVSMEQLLTIYTSRIRPVLEYACQVWHPGLIKGQTDLIESVQKRALRIIMPDASYELALEIAELPSLAQRRKDLCIKLFDEIKCESHKLHHLLPPVKCSNHGIRDVKTYPLPKCRVDRTKKTFINWCLFNLQ